MIDRGKTKTKKNTRKDKDRESVCLQGFLLLFRKMEAGPAMEPGPAALQLLSAEEWILEGKI